MSNAAFWFSKLGRMLPRASAASRLAVTADQISDLLRGMRALTSSGAQVNSSSAMQVGAVYACVRVLADSVAMLPLQLYGIGTDGRSSHAREHPVDRVLRVRPNSWQTPLEFKRMLMGHLALRGNAYAHIVRVTGKVTALVPLHPDQMQVEVQPGGGLSYKYRQRSGVEVLYKQSEIMHLRNLSVDGVRGLSPIEAAREAIGLAMQTEKHGAKLFSNAATPAGVLKHPAQLSAEAAERLKADFESRHAGADNAHRTMLLEEGLTWEKLGLTAEESQFIDSRKFQRNEIAMFFGVPPHMIGDVERGTSWGSGIEQQGLGFVTYTLLPHLTNFAQAVARDLLTDAERDTYHAAFDTEALTRADFLTRQQGLQIMRNAGVINANEWRQREGLNPRTDAAGDDYVVGDNPVHITASPTATRNLRETAHAA